MPLFVSFFCFQWMTSSGKDIDAGTAYLVITLLAGLEDPMLYLSNFLKENHKFTKAYDSVNTMLYDIEDRTGTTSTHNPDSCELGEIVMENASFSIKAGLCKKVMAKIAGYSHLQNAEKDTYYEKIIMGSLGENFEKYFSQD